MKSTNARRLPALPSLPKIRSVYPCQCGCGLVCTNRFRPGHDAKLLGQVKRVQLGLMTLEQLDEVLGPGSALATAAALGMDYVPLADREVAETA